MFSRTIKSCKVIKNSIHTDSRFKIGVLGVPFDKGQPKVGVANGPKYIRSNGLINKLQQIRKFLK